MIEVEVKYPNSLMGLGYIAGGIIALLKPYKEGKELHLNEQDKQIIERGERFFDSALIGCESIENLDSSPNLFTYREDESFVLSPASAFHTALYILISLPGFSQDLGSIKTKFLWYKNLLRNLETAKPCQDEEKPLLDEARVFFLKINELADLESYRFSQSDT